MSRVHWREGDLEPIEDAADPEPTDYAADTKHTALFSTDVRNFKFWRLQEAGFLLSDEGIPPFPLQWGWSVRHFPLEWRWHSIPTLRCTGAPPTSLRREWSTSTSHSKESIQLFPFLLSEVAIPPFHFEWEWSARHFPLLLGARVDPPLHPPTSLRRKWPAPTFHSKESTELAPFLLSEVAIPRFP